MIGPGHLVRSALFALLLLPLGSHAAGEVGWPEGWRFRVRVRAAKPAKSYDLWLDHGALMQRDGRDLRVFSAVGKPVSHFVCYAGSGRSRVLFDGASGPGEYAVYFGNFSSDLPAIPKGVSPLGRKDWAPEGGYTSVSYQPAKLDHLQVRDEKSLFAVMETVKAQAKALAEEEAEKQKDPSRRRRFRQGGIHATTAMQLPERWVHIVRAELHLENAGEYEISVEGDRSRFRVLFVDGNRQKAVIPGWYGSGQHRSHLSTWSGKTRLTEGRHVFELYTWLRHTPITLRHLGRREGPWTLTGRDAHYEAQRVAAEPLEAAGGVDPGAAILEAIRAWCDQGETTRALEAARFARERFAAAPDFLARLAEEREKVLELAYARNWLTEGKYITRTGAVPDAVFSPPLASRSERVPHRLNNRAWLSSTAWVEGQLIYGLPFPVQEIPWGLTSGITLVDDTLYVGVKNGQMHAVGVSTGQLKWTFPGNGSCRGCPLVYRGVVYYGSVDRRLYAIDAEGGRMLWNYPSRGFIEGSPCALDGRIYFGSRDGHVYAVDARLGIDRWRADLGAPVVGTPATDGKAVYIGAKNGTFFALSAASGETLWKYEAGAEIHGGCCVWKDRVCFGDANGRVHCLAVREGKPCWPPVDAGGPVVAAPILVGSAFYGGTANGIAWGVHAEEGLLGWRHLVEPRPGQRARFLRPALYAEGKLVYVATPFGVVSFGQSRLSRQPCYLKGGDVTVDGELDEVAWQEAHRLPDLLRPDGMALADRVRARMMWDDTNLYVSVICQDTDLVNGDHERDGELQEADSITLLIDPRRDGLAVPAFTLSPRGVQGDAILLALSGDPADPATKKRIESLRLKETGKAWQPEWRTAVKLDGTLRKPGEEPTDGDRGWQAELAIPWKSFPPQLVRHAPHHNWTWLFNLVVTDVHGRRRSPLTIGLAPQSDAARTGEHGRWPELHFQQTTK